MNLQKSATAAASPVANLPESWSWTKFGYHFTESQERNGENPPGPLLSVSEYRGVELNNRTIGQQASLDVAHYRVVRPGQLAANMMWLNHGGLGVSELVGHISPAYKAFWISASYESRFVHYLLRCSGYINYFSAVGTGVRPNSQMVTSTVLGMMPLPLPPKDTQRAIADYLDRETGEIDAMIAKMDELTEELKGRRSAAIDVEVWQIISDDTTPNFHTRPLWSFASINDEVLSEKSEDSFLFEYVDISSVTEGKISDQLERFTFRSAPSRARRVARTGDVIISTVRTYLRAISRVVETDFPRIYSTGFAVIRPIPEEGDSRFLAYALSSSQVMDGIIASSVGVSYPAIQASQLTSLQLPSIPLEEQRRIADHLDEVTSRIDTMLAKVAELKSLLTERRAALITDVVTGRKEVA